MGQVKLIYNLNGKNLELNLGRDTNFDLRLFDLFIGKLEKASFNDDGENAGFKKELRKFDISEDKQFGNEWTFSVSENSKDLLKRFIEKHRYWNHAIWKLKGNDFSVSFESDDNAFREKVDSFSVSDNEIVWNIDFKGNSEFEEDIKRLLENHEGSDKK